MKRDKYLICKGPGDDESLFEEPLTKFFCKSFKSKEIFIISPWVSTIELRKRKIIYYPYISTTSLIEVFRALIKNGVKVHIATRCFDFIDDHLIAIAYNVAYGPHKYHINKELEQYIKEELVNVVRRTQTLLSINELSNIDLKFDIEQKLHSKVFINDFMALMGSLNLTHYGMYRNYECIITVFREKDPEAYDALREYAEKIMRGLYDLKTCEINVLKALESFLNMKLPGLRDLVELLEEILIKI
jgi:phosphatidylserine/phosphatidylglycerophosphate/cardiolipin synthase-like enzyme